MNGQGLCVGCGDHYAAADEYFVWGFSGGRMSGEDDHSEWKEIFPSRLDLAYY